jgi:hypothetical protein
MRTRQVFFITPLVVILLNSASPSQAQTSSSLLATADRVKKCRDVKPFAFGPEKDQRLTSSLSTVNRSETAISETIGVCEHLLSEESSPQISRTEGAVGSDTRAPLRGLSANQPAPGIPATSLALDLDRETGLRDIGQDGTTIARAREAVYEILSRDNTCSAWFEQADPRIADTFLSLAFSVDEEGSKRIIKERNDEGTWIVHGPYIAKTWQRGGPGTTITINRNGAFFQRTGDIYQVSWVGGIPNFSGGWKYLHVGPFIGGSVQAQIIAILHELAHVVGAAPADDSSIVGFALSQENTALILRHCRSQAAESVRTTRALATSIGNP